MKNDVWQAWEQATTEHRGSIVVGFVSGYGLFDMRQGIIYRAFNSSGKTLATARPATPDELAELDWAVAHGCLQIEIRPPIGIFHGQAGFGTAAAAENPIITIWQANGREADMLATIEPATLTTDEADELADHEAIIEQSQAVFVEVGNALMAIRDAKLYRASHPTFDAYLAARWPAISKRRGYQLIDAAAIAKSVPITNERQARALKGVPAEQAKQAFAAATQATNGQPTGKAIEQALRPEKHANGLPVDFDAYEAKALACNLRLFFDGEYHVTGLPDGPRTSSHWSGIKDFIDDRQAIYQAQARTVALVEERQRLGQTQATPEPSPEADPLWCIRTLQSKLASSFYNAVRLEDRKQLRLLASELIAALEAYDKVR